MTQMALFGITGDLARRRLIPAISRLWEKGKLGKDSRFIGFGRKPFSDEEFHTFISEYVPIKDKATFASKWIYIQSELDDVKGYKKLAAFFGENKKSSKKDAPKALVYISLPPQYQKLIAANLFKSGALKKNDGGIIAIEKPFGNGSNGAKNLDAFLRTKISEDQIYRIDHYAGKQELIHIEELGRKGKLDHLGKEAINGIEIHFNEKGTAKGRGAFYDNVGALNDVVQNHVLHMLGTVIAAPYAKHPAHGKFRAAAATLLKPSGKPEFGQYESFRKETGVHDKSKTETYFKLENFVTVAGKNATKEEKEIAKRWSGTRVTLRGGKGMSEDMVKICFEGKPGNKKNHFIDEDGKTLCIETMRHGAKDAYETIFEAMIAGDMSRSISVDQIVAGWKHVEKVKKMGGEVKIYKEGTI